MAKRSAARKAFFIFFLFSLLLAFDPISLGAKSETKNNEDQLSVDFETRLRFYLDLKTRRFLERMSLKEQMLTQMIRSVAHEIQSRGSGQLTEQLLGMDKIHEKEDKLVAAYRNEISLMEKIIIQVDSLSQVVQRKDDWKLLREVEQIKDQLSDALDKSKLQSGVVSGADMSLMIHEYSGEINRLLRLFEQIEAFQKRAAARGDENLVQELDRQKARILQIVEKSRIANTEPDQIVEEYIKESTDIVGILRELDQLQAGAAPDSAAESTIDQTRGRIMSSIDGRILALFDYAQAMPSKKLTVSERFMQWKAARVAQFQVNFTRYKILHTKLIRLATPQQRDRMLESEISDALLTYADGKYELAAMIFDRILTDYQEYYPNLDGVIFYRSEANFANNYYDEAQKGYLDIVKNYPHSKFLGQCYLRLLAINYTYQLDDEFFKYYAKLENFNNLDPEDVNKAHYLAADIYIRRQQYDKARIALAKISKGSRYYLVAQYLQGTVFANLNEYKQAKKTFENVVHQKIFPWTDLNNAIIRNEALLKLGYLHFQLGEYDAALANFSQISAGYDEYDKSLIGQAWANLKKGKYNTVINKVDAIFSNYLMTNYIYEAKVLAAHCKRAQNKTQEALSDLRYVANARRVLNRVEEYNKERSKLLKQLDQVDALEEKILDHQNRTLYPKLVRARNLINEALSSFRYRTATSSLAVEEYSNERKILVKQIAEFDRIIDYARQEQNKKMLANAVKQRNRLVSVLQRYQFSRPTTPVSYFLDYPMATKEAGVVYRRGIFNKLVGNMAEEKQQLGKDLQAISELSLRMSGEDIDVAVDLEVLQDDLVDLNKQLNRFEIWLRNHRVEEVETQTIQWANFSGFGISDINFSLFREKNQQIMALSRNLTKIETILQEKKDKLEQRITRFDTEMRKIQKEMEAEKIRLEKLEKEKYFQELYFDTKTREVEEGSENLESLQRQLKQGGGNK
ncbi:MAG: tetratricopeptide repeat protein [Calditrichaeota bacterium]|nr:tetratricopeptide repeat protein [Calditrichota bacterium]